MTWSNELKETVSILVFVSDWLKLTENASLTHGLMYAFSKYRPSTA